VRFPFVDSFFSSPVRNDVLVMRPEAHCAAAPVPGGCFGFSLIRTGEHGGAIADESYSPRPIARRPPEAARLSPPPRTRAAQDAAHFGKRRPKNVRPALPWIVCLSPSAQCKHPPAARSGFRMSGGGNTTTNSRSDLREIMVDWNRPFLLRHPRPTIDRPARLWVCSRRSTRSDRSAAGLDRFAEADDPRVRGRSGLGPSRISTV